MTDHLGVLITALNNALPDAYVGDELPPAAALEQRLPIVQVLDLPLGSTHTPWQAGAGPLTDVASFDFYVLARTREQSRDLAAEVRGVLFRLVLGDFGIRRVIEESGFSRAADWNDRVKREHGEYSFEFAAA